MSPFWLRNVFAFMASGRYNAQGKVFSRATHFIYTKNTVPSNFRYDIISLLLCVVKELPKTTLIIAR